LSRPSLGQDLAGIFQRTNRATNQAVPTSGGWGLLSVQAAHNLRFHLGYRFDNASDSGRFGLTLNSPVFATVRWDVNPWPQLGLEGNDRLTNDEGFGDWNAWVVISEVLFRL